MSVFFALLLILLCGNSYHFDFSFLTEQHIHGGGKNATDDPNDPSKIPTVGQKADTEVDHQNEHPINVADQFKACGVFLMFFGVLLQLQQLLICAAQITGAHDDVNADGDKHKQCRSAREYEFLKNWEQAGHYDK